MIVKYINHHSGKSTTMRAYALQTDAHYFMRIRIAVNFPVQFDSLPHFLGIAIAYGTFDKITEKIAQQ